MLTAFGLAILGALVAKFFRLSALVLLSSLVLIGQIAGTIIVGSYGLSSILRLIGYLCAAQGGYLLGSYVTHQDTREPPRLE